MKKLLVLMLVLGLTSIAGAAVGSNTGKVVQLSVDGVVTDEYFTEPGTELDESDTVTLDITLADGYAMDAMELDLEVIGAATISLPDPATDIIVADFESWSLVVDDVTAKGIGVMAGVTFGQVSGLLVDHITFHCEGDGYVTVNLTIAGTNQIVAPEKRILTAADLGSIVIGQVPEPMTITLLGLGGLALLRRRK
jgi:hypothetical protein